MANYLNDGTAGNILITDTGDLLTDFVVGGAEMMAATEAPDACAISGTVTTGPTVPPWVRIFDFGLSVLDSEADQILICNTQPTTYNEATVTYKLGAKNFGVSGGAF